MPRCNGTGGTFPGVLVSNGGVGITIRGNSIHDNTGLGIDLNGGATRNESTHGPLNLLQDVNRRITDFFAILPDLQSFTPAQGK